jgi:hypothetical protein
MRITARLVARALLPLLAPATGGICAACDSPVTAQEIEVECDLPAGGTIRLHRTCYDVWSRELPARPS